jgi:hypothetical protein
VEGNPLATTAVLQTTTLRIGWLRGRSFDLVFILGTAILALGTAAVIATRPEMFTWILIPYLWLLGYPHLIATYTRTAFDRQSMWAHRFLNFGLPVLLLGTIALLAATVGTWPLVTTYLYWQWFHFTRQSYGVSRAYVRRAGGALEDEKLTHWLVYLVPIWGILYRSYQAPETYLGSELRVVPVPFVVVAMVGAATSALLARWVLGRAVAWVRGELPVAHTLYMVSHFAMFIAGYLLIPDINLGWLALSVWHSAQYLLFVWLFNNNRFKAGVDPQRRFLSAISQAHRGAGFYLVCCAISTLFFIGLTFGLEAVRIPALPVALVVYYAINFHHYTVDGLVWRSKRKPQPVAAA